MEKIKLRPNEWMINEQFLSKIDYHNKYYIESLGKILYSYIETIPIPVISTWDPLNKRIYILVGQEKRFFEVDENISYFDFTFLVDSWLKKFFPKFCIEEECKIPLDDNEIIEKVKNGMSLDDALLERKDAKIKDIGVITKIQITNDEFYFNRNGNEHIRITGSLDNLIPLSVFLKTLREIKNDIEKRDFILNNSRELKSVSNNKAQIIVDYPEMMMMNFFIIRYETMKKIPLLRITEKLYEWKHFKITFKSEGNERDCIRYLKQKRLDDNIQIED